MCNTVGKVTRIILGTDNQWTHCQTDFKAAYKTNYEYTAGTAFRQVNFFISVEKRIFQQSHNITNNKLDSDISTFCCL